MAQGIIQQVNQSKSGKTLGVQIGGQWYSTKHFELQNHVGETITFDTSTSEFNGTTMHWLNDYTLAGADMTPAAQAFNQQHQQNAGQTAPQTASQPAQAPTDKDLTITALALVKCLEGLKTPQQAYEAFEETKRLLTGTSDVPFDDEIPGW